MADQNKTPQVELKTPYFKAELGEFVTVADLFDYNGIFYTQGDRTLCDMPTMTFERDAASGHYKRIE